ncbi:unnamed protein product [Ostreobium quekettii]|uniref:Ribosomal protein S21 n=1 Tax=Ostreobium quekettii TaxID=121088 RepID=A0A8S1J4J8_9CHLO|nr:unnamed protein product [Ostreobium quekettii]|eukprot:evm.model.scf_609.6 EVM.evm.TU.scf_609.6   scf_609:47149-49411(-)
MSGALLRAGLKCAGVALLPLGAPPSWSSLRAGLGAAAAGQQSRGVLSIDVYDDKVDRALAILRRRATEEKYEEKWRQIYHEKGSLKRRKMRKEAEFKRYKAQVRERMQWITRHRARGF